MWIYRCHPTPHRPPGLAFQGVVGEGLGVAHLQQGGVVGLLDEADFNGFVLHTIWRRRRSLCGWVFCWVHRLSWQHFPENSVRRQPVRSSLARNGVRRPELPLRREKETHLFSRSNSNSFGVILGSAPVCCHCFLKHNPQYQYNTNNNKTPPPWRACRRRRSRRFRPQ